MRKITEIFGIGTVMVAAGFSVGSFAFSSSPSTPQEPLPKPDHSITKSLDQPELHNDHDDSQQAQSDKLHKIMKTKTWPDLKPCKSDDQTSDCYWDALKQGNGHGDSFIQYQGKTYYM